MKVKLLIRKTYYEGKPYYKGQIFTLKKGDLERYDGIVEIIDKGGNNGKKRNENN